VPCNAVVHPFEPDVLDDVEEQTIHTDSHFVAVVKIREYLEQANADAAMSYYAGHLGRGLPEVGQLREVAERPDVIRAVVERQ
jgi:hypothetical protein